MKNKACLCMNLSITKRTHEDVPGIAEEKGRLHKNSPVIQPFINQSECAQVISSALML